MSSNKLRQRPYPWEQRTCFTHHYYSYQLTTARHPATGQPPRSVPLTDILIIYRKPSSLLFIFLSSSFLQARIEFERHRPQEIQHVPSGVGAQPRRPHSITRVGIQL